MIVSDASPLINLAKAEKLYLHFLTFDKTITPVPPPVSASHQ